MATEVLNLGAIFAGIPIGAWVAYSESRHQVMSVGLDSHEVMQEARTKGEPHPLLLRVPDPEVALIM